MRMRDRRDPAHRVHCAPPLRRWMRRRIANPGVVVGTVWKVLGLSEPCFRHASAAAAVGGKRLGRLSAPGADLE
jgi:hypothetical protein